MELSHGILLHASFPEVPVQWFTSIFLDRRFKKKGGDQTQACTHASFELENIES